MLSEEQIKNELYSALVSFHELCDKLQITYFLAYGTLLGAVRHNDFIPWDNDVDVIMPRNDYEKLLNSKELIKEYSNGKYLLQEEYVDILLPFSKFCISNYPIKEENRIDTTFLYIDVFPIDYISQKALKKIEFYKILMICKGLKTFKKANTNFFKKMLLLPIFLLSKIVSCKSIKKKQMAILRKNRGNIPLCLMWSYKKEINDTKIDFNEFSLIKFRNREFKCPKNYDHYLKIIYGNWKKLPEINERKPGHTYNFLSTSNNEKINEG